MTNTETGAAPEAEVKAAGSEVAVQDAPSGGTALQVDMNTIDFEEDSGQGAENITAKMLVIPFISIIQSTSAYVKKSDPAGYIKGAEEGFIINTASKQMWDGTSAKDEGGINIVVALVRSKHVEWVPREKGGGLVKIWDDETYKTLPGYVKAEKGLKIITPEGNEIIEYLDLYAIIQDRTTKDFFRGLFSAKSTSIKPTRQLLTNLTSLKLPSAKKPGKFFQPPMFYSMVRMTTVGQSNSQGAWFTPKFDLIGQTIQQENGEAIYLEARKFYEDVQKGEVKIDEAGRERATGEVGEGDLPF